MNQVPLRPFAPRALVAAGVVLLLSAASLPCLLEQARDVDVLLYAAAAVRANAHHALPYEAAWIEKGPLAMGLYQVLFLIFGNGNIAAIAAAWLALALAGAALSWRLASVCEEASPPAPADRSAPGGARAVSTAGPWAAVLFAVSVGTVGGTLNTEIPASVAAACAVLLWMHAARRGASGGALLASGALVGVLAAAALLCRQNAGAVWPLLVAGEALLVFQGRRAAADAVRSALAVSAALVATVGAVVGIYALRGTLADMLFCVYGYNATIYIAATKADAARWLGAPFVAGAHFLLPVWTTSALGLAGLAIAAARLRRRRGEDDGAFLMPVLALVAIGLTLSLFPGLRLFSHYFAMPLPFWAALGGAAAALLTRPRRARLALAASAIIALSLGAELSRRPWAATARALREWVADGGLAHPGDALYWPGHDPLAGKASRWLRENSAPDDTVFVWGMRPHVPIYAGRSPATRFVTCTFLTGLVPWERVGSEEDTTRWIVPGSWDRLAHDLDTERPRFIVDASHDHLFAMGAYAPAKFPSCRSGSTRPTSARSTREGRSGS